MKHDDYRELLLLSASGMLDGDESALLERHMAQCEQCRNDYAVQQRVHAALDTVRPEPGEDLLNEARRELRAALRKERSAESHWRRWSDLRAVPAGYGLALGAACTLALGIVIGKMVLPAVPGTAPTETSRMLAAGARPVEGETRIANVRFLGSRGGEVEFVFDAVTPVRMKGSVDDPGIQKVLARAMVNGENPGVRMKAITAVSSPGGERRDRRVEAALIQVLRKDANAGVRQEALNALRMLPFDDEIKQAFLHTLMADGNPGLRIAAINSLDSERTPGQGVDRDIIDVLQQKAHTDDNTYIRLKAEAVIREAQQQ